MISQNALNQLKAAHPVDVIAGEWVHLRRQGRKLAGPCPICSRDGQAKDDKRFVVFEDRESWGCAACGGGGDVIALVRGREGLDFLAAIEWLGGAREVDPETAKQREREREQRRLEHERRENTFRERERRVCWGIWSEAVPIAGSTAEAYLRLRGLTRLPERAQLRCIEDMPYYLTGDDRAEIIHRGPAMAAAIVGPTGLFAGIHLTYIDLATPKGKVELRHPATGEPLDAKKSRGSKAGGHVVLTAPAFPEELVTGEGIETTAAVWLALTESGRDLSRTAFWPALDLGNLAGAAAESVPHPILKDEGGRPRRFPGPVPDLARPALAIPDSVKRLVLLGDGDSEPFMTRCALARAGVRYAREGRSVRVAWAPDGNDFGDLVGYPAQIVALFDAAGPPVAPTIAPEKMRAKKASAAGASPPPAAPARPPGRRPGRRPWPDDRAPWIYDCLPDARGEPLGCLANAMLPLRRDPAIAGLFAYDELYCGAMLLGPVPGMPEDKGPWPRPVGDVHVGFVQEYIQLAGLARLSKDVIHQAVDQRAMENAFHPVRDYLGALAWDGTPRLHDWLTTYLGVKASPYAQRIGTMFMISMVARVYRPGCKVDHVLILEGPQGKMKSTACRALAGEWFSDHLPPIATAGKDVSQHLRGKWLIEIAEMNAMDKAASAALKAFITRDTERYRASFGRRESVEPRQCVFVITTNEKEYLRDPTGARRYWPDKVGTIDIDALKRDRDQLFAEAVHEFNADTPWWPDREFEREHAHPQQEARYEADVWEDKISVWLAEQRYTARQNNARARVTVGQVAMECLKFEVAKIGTHDTRRITAALTRLGWDREFGDGTDSRGRRPWICLADGIAETVEI
jgi:hypothetical protein